MESRKQAVSIRMSAADVRNVKKLARRLGVRDSDIVRFAVKTMLARLAPLCDPGIRGRDLVPLLAEHGPDLCRHFDIDVNQLEAIVNDNVDERRRVDRDDIQLVAMTHMQRSYVGVRLLEQSRRMRALGQTAPAPEQREDTPLQTYLFAKYLGDTYPAFDAPTDKKATG